MSAAMMERVWVARGLDPAARMVMLSVARDVPDGATEVLVNRSALARRLETNIALLGRAFRDGERVGLVRVMASGRVAFLTDGLPLSATASLPSEGKPAVRPAEGPPVLSPGAVTAQWVLSEFGKRWEERYGQRYIFSWAKDTMLAKRIAQELTGEEILRRIRAYCQSEEPFVVECVHSFGYFAKSGINAVAAATAPPRRAGRVMDERETERFLRGEARR